MQEKFSPLQFKLPQFLKLTLKCQRAVKCFLWHRVIDVMTSFIPHSVYSRLPCGVQIAVRTQSTQWNSGAQIVHSKFEVFFVRTWVFFGKVCFDFTKSEDQHTAVTGIHPRSYLGNQHLEGTNRVMKHSATYLRGLQVQRMLLGRVSTRQRPPPRLESALFSVVSGRLLLEKKKCF